MATVSGNKAGFRNDNLILGNVNEIGLYVVDHIDAMLAYWDKNQVCRFANNAYLEFFKKSRAELVGKITMKEFKGIYYEENIPYIKKVLKGKKQVFERKMLSPAGVKRYIVVKYYPDFDNGEVIGFFMHAEDITHIKKLQARVLELEKSKKRTVLRSLIETQEREREHIAHELRDNINQTLAYCKMTLANVSAGISQNIHKVIDEVNDLGLKLSPTIISMMGFCAGVREYIQSFQSLHPAEINFECENDAIDELSTNDKLSVFRIIQDYLLILANKPETNIISISIDFLPSKLSLRMSHNAPDFFLLKNSNEFKDIENRIDYYGGTWQEFKSKNEMVFLVNLKDLSIKKLNNSQTAIQIK